jgi:hypothetical protein
MDGMLRTGDPKMSADGEDRTLEAEVLAIKTVIAKVLARINGLDPMLADAIRGGLGDASDKIRKIVSKSKGAGRIPIRPLKRSPLLRLFALR